MALIIFLKYTSMKSMVFNGFLTIKMDKLVQSTAEMHRLLSGTVSRMFVMIRRVRKS